MAYISREVSIWNLDLTHFQKIPRTLFLWTKDNVIKREESLQTTWRKPFLKKFFRMCQWQCWIINHFVKNRKSNRINRCFGFSLYRVISSGGVLWSLFCPKIKVFNFGAGVVNGISFTDSGSPSPLPRP